MYSSPLGGTASSFGIILFRKVSLSLGTMVSSLYGYPDPLGRDLLGDRTFLRCIQANAYTRSSASAHIRFHGPRRRFYTRARGRHTALVNSPGGLPAIRPARKNTRGAPFNIHPVVWSITRGFYHLRISRAARDGYKSSRMRARTHRPENHTASS